MNYRLENISEDLFEDVVNAICKKNLGPAVVSFSKGRDGGRDGKFTGTVENFPTKGSSWTGKFIIQAKHTINPIGSFSDPKFISHLDKEFEKVKRLKLNNEIDNYLLYSNRKLSGNKHTELEQKIQDITGVKNVYIAGVETISHELTLHSDIVKNFKLDLAFIPFDFTDFELRDLIIEFKKQFIDNSVELKNAIENKKDEFKHTDKSIKNEKNKLGKDYYDYMIQNSFSYFQKIDDFLANDQNYEFRNMYENLYDELNSLILVKRSEFGMFEEIFVYLYQYVYERNSTLIKSRRLINVFFHHMYFNCNIGIK